MDVLIHTDIKTSFSQRKQENISNGVFIVLSHWDNMS